VRKSHENQVISILTIRKARTRVKKIYLKSNKKFQLKTEEPRRQKVQKRKTQMKNLSTNCWELMESLTLWTYAHLLAVYKLPV
jgi:hypothetical protein